MECPNAHIIYIFLSTFAEALIEHFKVSTEDTNLSQEDSLNKVGMGGTLGVILMQSSLEVYQVVWSPPPPPLQPLCLLSAIEMSLWY